MSLKLAPLTMKTRPTPIELPRQSKPAIARYKWAGLSWPARLQALYSIADKAAENNVIRVFVTNMILRPAGVGPRDAEAQQQAIYSWVTQNIYYVLEAGEYIQHPIDTLQFRLGDCDDAAVLIAAMAASIGLPYQFMLAGDDPSAPRRGQEWTSTTGLGMPNTPGHIYVELGAPEICIPGREGGLVCRIDYRKADTTSPWIPFGAVTSSRVTRGLAGSKLTLWDDRGALTWQAVALVVLLLLLTAVITWNLKGAAETSTYPGGA